MFEFDLTIIQRAIPFIVAGLPTTLAISLAGLVIGVVIGVPLGVLRTLGNRTVDILIISYIEVFRNVPVLVQIVWIYYVLPALAGMNLDAWTGGTIALGLNTSAFMAEIFRGGIVGISMGQYDASYSLGFTKTGSMRYVILPQVLRRMLSPLLNQFIVLIKESALVAYIGVLDVMHRGDLISTEFVRPLEAYTVVAAIYFVICFSASRFARWTEAKFAVPE